MAAQANTTDKLPALAIAGRETFDAFDVPAGVDRGTAILNKIQLSGTLLAKQEWRPSVGKRAGLPVFLSHGTQDPVLPYVMAERLRDELMKGGLDVEWHRFHGGHEIPEPVLSRLNAFLTKVLGKP